MSCHQRKVTQMFKKITSYLTLVRFSHSLVLAISCCVSLMLLSELRDSSKRKVVSLISMLTKRTNRSLLNDNYNFIFLVHNGFYVKEVTKCILKLVKQKRQGWYLEQVKLIRCFSDIVLYCISYSIV